MDFAGVLRLGQLSMDGVRVFCAFDDRKDVTGMLWWVLLEGMVLVRMVRAGQRPVVLKMVMAPMVFEAF